MAENQIFSQIILNKNWKITHPSLLRITFHKSKTNKISISQKMKGSYPLWSCTIDKSIASIPGSICEILSENWKIPHLHFYGKKFHKSKTKIRISHKNRKGATLYGHEPLIQLSWILLQTFWRYCPKTVNHPHPSFFTDKRP